MKHWALIILSLLALKGRAQAVVERDDLKALFDKYGVSGSIFIYDLRNKMWTGCHAEQLHQSFIPASTFKIFNSLVALETGVASGKRFVLKWDSVQRGRPEWNQDLEMRDAFRYSAVWYYQEIARRIGPQRMKEWLDKAGYGNADTSGGIDRFWLMGGLRITPAQQIAFLEKLYKGRLPFSERSMEIVKEIMVLEQNQRFTLCGKTGWGTVNDTDQVWFVGWLGQKRNVYFFATCLQGHGTPGADLVKARVELTKDALRALNLILE